MSEYLFTREVLHMGKVALEITEEPIIGNAGLAATGERMRVSGRDSICAKRDPLIESGGIGLKKTTHGRLVRLVRRSVSNVASRGGLSEALAGMQRRLAQA